MKKWLFLLLIAIMLSLAVFGQKIHVVKKGDTLWDLAGYYYNNPFIWRNIYNANIEKIKDPHWIYPGQEFVIPDVAADATLQEQPVEEKEITKKEEEIGFEKEIQEKEMEYTTSMGMDEQIGKVKQIREDIKKIERTKSYTIKNAVEYAVAKKLAFKAGYLSLQNPQIGKIDGLYKNSYQMVTNEKVYLKLNSENKNLIGKELIIFKWNNKVKDNKSGENLGKHVRIIGKVRIDGYENNFAYGTITASYDEINKGDFVSTYEEPQINPNSSYLKVSEDIYGSLIGTENPKTRTNEFTIVFINLGKNDGINTGDVFTVVRKDKTGKYFAAGALQVLVPYEKYSTATIISIKGNIDIKPYEEIKLSYRNKTEYLMKKYGELMNITGETNVIKEEVKEQVVTPEPVIEEVKEEQVVPVVEQKQITPQPVVKEEKPVVENKVETPNQQTPTKEKKEEATFIIEEEKKDTTPKDTVKGEEEIIIIEE
ncbi:MAG: LysM peptidoglycan-binding domain-containing protein [candidate division WOR-3 bacterium]